MFGLATFADADFGAATFAGDAYFPEATFTGYASFGATFGRLCALGPLRDHPQPSSTLHHTAVLSARPRSLAARPCPRPAAVTAPNADCADLAIVPTFRLDCRRGKGFVVP